MGGKSGVCPVIANRLLVDVGSSMGSESDVARALAKLVMAPRSYRINLLFLQSACC